MSFQKEIMFPGVTWVTESCYYVTFYEIRSENKFLWPIDYHLFPAPKQHPGITNLEMIAGGNNCETLSDYRGRGLLSTGSGKTLCHDTMPQLWRRVFGKAVR